VDWQQSEKHSRVEFCIAGTERPVLGKVAMMCCGLTIYNR